MSVPNKEDLAYETVVSPANNSSIDSKSNSIMNNCKRTKDMHIIHLNTDESSTARTEDETDDESLRLGPGFGSLYLASNSSLSDTGTYNSSPLDPTRVRSSSGLTSINEVVDRVAVTADREVWRRKSLLVDNDDDQYDYPSDEEGIKSSALAKNLFSREKESADDVYIKNDGRDAYKRTYPASFHCSTKLETNSSFEEPLSCREKFDQVCVCMSNCNLYYVPMIVYMNIISNHPALSTQPALGCDENLCSPSPRRKESDYQQTGQEEETEENEWVGLLVSGFYNMICTPYRR